MSQTYLFHLSNSMCAIHSLQIHLRIPIGVVYDDNISRGEIDAETARASRQHEDELLTVIRVILLDLPIAVLVGRLPVQATVLEFINKTEECDNEMIIHRSFKTICDPPML